MSLNWHLTKVAPEARAFIKSDDPRGWPVTESIIFHLGALGAGELTAKNWSEVYARYVFVNLLDERKPAIAAEEFKLRIGLSTNWMFKDESRASWVARVARRELDDIKGRVEREVSHHTSTEQEG